MHTEKGHLYLIGQTIRREFKKLSISTHLNT